MNNKNSNKNFSELEGQHFLIKQLQRMLEENEDNIKNEIRKHNEYIKKLYHDKYDFERQLDEAEKEFKKMKEKEGETL